jgi:hypothetical protein
MLLRSIAREGRSSLPDITTRNLSLDDRYGSYSFALSSARKSISHHNLRSFALEPMHLLQSVQCHVVAKTGRRDGGDVECSTDLLSACVMPVADRRFRPQS